MPLVQKWNWFCSVKGKNQERCSKTQIDIKNIWANRITEFLFPVIFLVTSGMHKAYFRSIFMKLPDCHITKPFFCNQNWWDCIFLGMNIIAFFSVALFLVAFIAWIIPFLEWMYRQQWWLIPLWNDWYVKLRP